MNWKVLLKLQSGLLIILGLFLLIPNLHALIYKTGASSAFYFTSFTAIFVGLIVFFLIRTKVDELNHKMGFIIVTSSWVLACIVGALPYYISGTMNNFIDCIFEAISGFTGTGASVIIDLEATNRSILLWRSLTQWLGGMGIIVFFIAVLPMLGVGGQQLFQAESTGPSKDKMTPKIRDTARNLWRLYVGFTLILVFFLILAGMSSFDAFNHAMTTMATGGFSTKNSGIAFYKSAIIDYLFIAFMFIGAINFGLHYRLIFKRDFSVLKDTEFKGYLLIIFLITALIFQANIYNEIPISTDNLEQNFRSSLFTVINILSSTGYTHDNYLLWPAICHYLLVLIMLVGGMSGSTAGGIKVIRLVASIKLLFKELRQAIHPSAILSIKINNKTARDKTANAIWGFVFIYLFCLAFISGILVYTGLDLVTATSATISAMSNIGPALGKLGPMDNYAFLSPTAKSALCLAMLLGRLEFMAILVLLMPEYWRK